MSEGQKPTGPSGACDFRNLAEATRFYEERYQRGYMEEWPPEKKARVHAVVQELELPATGRALDFGCGEGVFTDVLQRALPGWSLSGTDVSETALAHARTRMPQARFVKPEELVSAGERFDLVFSHHVLEHVQDLQAAWRQLTGLAGTGASMLHILPCGNPGSFEHGIASMREGGIDPARENRFFFEDVGHLRRLTTQQVVQLALGQGFKLEREYYAGQYHGAIDWITAAGPQFLWRLFDPSKARSAAEREKLQRERRRLLFPSALRMLSAQVRNRSAKPHKSPKDWLLLLAGSPLYIATRPLTRRLDTEYHARAEGEWTAHRTERGGSEMYLFFRRAG